MLNTLQLTAAVGGVCLVLGTALGWQVSDWKWKASRAESEEQAAEQYRQAIATSNKKAEEMQAVIDRLDGKKFVVLKELHHETTKVEYRCPIPDSGRLLYVRAAKGDASVASDLPNPVRSPGAATGE